MENLKAYTITNIDSKTATLFRSATKFVLDSTETRKVYYIGDSLNIRKGKNICIVPLKQEKLGYIIYLCNYVCGLGDFYFVPNKIYSKIKELSFSSIREDVNNWRKLYYYQSILDEFICPKEKLENEIKELIIEKEKAMNDFNNKEITLNNLKKYLTKINL